MAVTSIWSVKGWLGKVLIYVENPEKTENPDFIKERGNAKADMQGLSDVIAYAVDEEKTRQRAEGRPNRCKDVVDDEDVVILQQYVSGVNCAPVTARTEMLAVKKRYGKEGGIMAFHGYQSFAPGECTPTMAHEIGVKLAEELWGERFQVLVATHLDKSHHLHNHFVVNSVSFRDGLRYHRTNQDYRDMRRASDRLCREYGLSVIKKPAGKAKHYGEWRAEQEERPTYRGMVRADIEEAIAKAQTEKQFYQYLKEKGYTFKFGKDITICQKGRERGLKLARNFGEEYTVEAIRRRILSTTKTTGQPEGIRTDHKRAFSQWKEGNCSYPVSDVSKRYGEYKKRVILKVKGGHKCTRKIGGLRGQYLRYCYLLGILPKNGASVSTGKLHALLKEDLIKLNTISKETRLLCHYRIDTAEQLFSFKENLQEQMEGLVDRRKHLRYQSRSMRDEEKLAVVKAKIGNLSEEIRELRKKVGLCDGIATRSGEIGEKIEIMQAEKNREKEAKNYEHIRRSR